MDEDASLALGGHNQHYAQEVRGETRPGRVGNGHYGAVHEGFNLVTVLLGDHYVVSFLLNLDAHTAETLGNDSKVLHRNVLDGEGGAGDGRKAYEASHFDHIRKDGVVCSAQFLDACYGEQVGAYALYLGAHCREQAAKLLDVRLAGGVVDCGFAFCQDAGHHNVGGTGDGGFVQKHIATLEALGRFKEESAFLVLVGKGGSQLAEAVNVGVHAAAANLVAARLCEIRAAEAGKERSYHHYGAPEAGAGAHEVSAADV